MYKPLKKKKDIFGFHHNVSEKFENNINNSQTLRGGCLAHLK